LCGRTGGSTLPSVDADAPSAKTAASATGRIKVITPIGQKNEEPQSDQNNGPVRVSRSQGSIVARSACIEGGVAQKHHYIYFEQEQDRSIQISVE
jgi:hypothetical protein